MLLRSASIVDYKAAKSVNMLLMCITSQFFINHRRTNLRDVTLFKRDEFWTPVDMCAGSSNYIKPHDKSIISNTNSHGFKGVNRAKCCSCCRDRMGPRVEEEHGELDQIQEVHRDSLSRYPTWKTSSFQPYLQDSERKSTRPSYR